MSEFYVVNYRLSGPAKEGSLTILLRAIIELELEFGMFPCQPIGLQSSPDDNNPSRHIQYHKADARALIAGKMSEADYISRHSSVIDS